MPPDTPAPGTTEFEPWQLLDLAEDETSHAGRLVRWAVAEIERLSRSRASLAARLRASKDGGGGEWDSALEVAAKEVEGAHEW